jgi:hypothetical protein
MAHRRFHHSRLPPLNKRGQQIHDAIVALAHNESLSLVHAVLGKRMRRIRYSGNHLAANWDASYRRR